MQKIRIKAVQAIISFLDRLFFQPKLRAFYKARINSLKPVIIDVGGNKGQTIDFHLRLNPNSIIYSIEANPRLSSMLKGNYEGRNSVKIFDIAISSEEEEKEFLINKMDETSSFEIPNLQSQYLKRKAKILGSKNPEDLIKEKIKIRTTTLSNFIKNHVEQTRIDIIKIDVEGHEFECLRGLEEILRNKNYCIQFIQLENHTDDMYKNHQVEIEKLLVKNGFILEKSIKHGFGNLYENIYSLA